MFLLFITLFLALFLHCAFVNALEAEGRLNKVSIGLPEKGRIMAVGHFTQERELDLFIRSEDRLSFSIWKWSSSTNSFQKHLEMHLSIPIVNMIATDFNHDGLLDLMVMCQNTESSSVSIQIFHQFERELRKANWVFEDFDGQPIIMDYNLDMLVDIFGVKNGRPVFYQAVSDKENGLVSSYEQLSGPTDMCQLKQPQFSAHADFDGDGIADLMVVCADGTLEVWRNADGALKKGKSFKGINVDGPLTIADFNGDGAIDILYYGDDNSLKIHLNQQKRFCSERDDDSGCKKTNQLFSFDPSYGFSSEPSITIKMAEVFGSKDGWFGKHVEATLVTRDSFNVPLALHAGDFDMDGYPDILLVYKNAEESEQIPAILRNVPANNTFIYQTKGTGSLASIKNAETAAFLPFTPNTRLPDIIVQTSDQKIVALRNAFFQDAFFLQVEIMGAVCPKGGHRCKELKAATDHPFGTGQPGGTFKYNYADNSGKSRVQQGTQMSQSAYMALPLPYMVFGLGRVSNFIEQAQAALGNKNSNTSHRLTHLIPNSRLLLFPPRVPMDTKWHAELYINPSDYILPVGIAAASIITIFAMLTGFFKFREIREDNIERRRTLHAINFDAL